MEKNNINLEKKTKIWLVMILQIFLKDGKKLKYKNYLKYIIFRIIKEFGSLNNFFINFYKILFFPFYFRTHVVAGRKVILPLILKKNKEIFYMVKYLKNAVKNRSEIFFKDRLFSELKDIFLESDASLTRKKIFHFYDEVSVNFVNLRFIRVLK